MLEDRNDDLAVGDVGEDATASSARARGPVVVAVQKALPKAATEVTVHYADGRISIGRIPVRLFAAVMRSLSHAEAPTD